VFEMNWKKSEQLNMFQYTVDMGKGWFFKSDFEHVFSYQLSL